jgi:hypothetical protein
MPPGEAEPSLNERFHPWTRGFGPSRLKPMAKVTILCHPVTPVPPAELEDWLELQLNQLRSNAPVIARMSRLTQPLPNSEVAAGWLIEVELTDESHPLDRDDLTDALANVFSDMRFLGMQPMLLFPHDLSDLSRALDKALSPLPSVNGPVLTYPGLR